MSDTATEVTPEQAPAPEPEQATSPPPEQEPALNVEDDAAVDAALQDAAISIPGDEGVVPTSEAGKIAGAYRGKIRELKAELEKEKGSASKVAQLEQQLQQLSQQLQATQPYVQAYQAMTQAAQQAAAPEDTSEAEEYARLLDLYTSEGKPDIERGKKGLALQRRLAEQVAQQHVAPIQQQSAHQMSAHHLARAKATTLPNGMKVDPGILDMVWKKLDPALTATPEGAQQAFVVALGYSSLAPAQAPQAPKPAQPRAPGGQFTAPDAAPIFTEKAGGKVGQQSGLDPTELAYIKKAGISEKDYLESANKAPWLRR